MKVTMKITVVWDLTPCSLVHVYQYSSEISLNLSDFMASHLMRQSLKKKALSDQQVKIQCKKFYDA
jgi:hypothetical protein